MEKSTVHCIGRFYFGLLWNLPTRLLIVAVVLSSIGPSARAQSQSASAQSGGNATASQTSMGTGSPGTTASAASSAAAPENTQNAGAQTANVMSADEIIAILRQEPNLLSTLKEAIAQRSGVDPSTISNDAVFARIQQDPALRVQATTMLNRFGFSTNTAQGNETSTLKSAGPVRPRRPAAGQLSPDVDPDLPKSIQQLSPYEDLPSLHDLYTQIPPAGGELRRFGSEAFLVGTGNADELPMDLPVGPDYVLGPGDDIVVNMWGGRSERLSITVDRQGQIALPEAGTITLDRLTIAQAQNAIQKALATQFQNEHVEISLGRLRTVRIYVVGDVQRPGAYDVSSLSTPLSALYAAGGPTSRGSLRVLRHYRGSDLVSTIDLYDFLLRGVRSDTDRLLPGDTILVPSAGPEVTVEGMVHRPAIYELNGEQHLDQVLDLAGGTLISANLKQINVQRIEAHERRTMISVELPDGAERARQTLSAFPVQGGDDVVISQILPYNQQAVYLEGHVFRPGKYAYRDGMTITDLLHSYQDVMPEPADHAELVRLQPPDYRPETISLSLADLMIGNNPIPLRPFDLIRIFSRYEIDVPEVSIAGEVLRPGDYPMSQGMTVAGLIRMAGGFKRSAYADEADLSSYGVENGQKVLIHLETVDLRKAFEGDKTADTLLKPGDVVSVRQLAGWQDIGSSITIEGEVEHAGSYGIEQGERLSSALKRAGGFRETAYPPAAILERIQVRELGEQARQQMIQRLETTPFDVKAGILSPQDQISLQQSLQQQRLEVLAGLRSHPASGRQVINISSDIGKWENTAADIELRAGDRLVIPKRPTFVLVSGQVYNATAISYVPGRDISWYLAKAGGATSSGDKRGIYVLRADGSIMMRGSSWISGDFHDLHLRPGDSIIVPEKLIGGSQIWRNLISTAQILSAAALPLAISGVF